MAARGFRVSPLARESGLAVTASGRALVDSTLASISHPEVYVIGDAAAVADWGDQLAMGCRTGGFTGPHVADVIAARLTYRRPRDFPVPLPARVHQPRSTRGLVKFLHHDQAPHQPHPYRACRRVVLERNPQPGSPVVPQARPHLPRRRHVASVVADAPGLAGRGQTEPVSGGTGDSITGCGSWSPGWCTHATRARGRADPPPALVQVPAEHSGALRDRSRPRSWISPTASSTDSTSVPDGPVVWLVAAVLRP
jgi:hypothetical protein